MRGKELQRFVSWTTSSQASLEEAEERAESGLEMFQKQNKN
jgi:hypothetical protein